MINGKQQTPPWLVQGGREFLKRLRETYRLSGIQDKEEPWEQCIQGEGPTTSCVTRRYSRSTTTLPGQTWVSRQLRSWTSSTKLLPPRCPKPSPQACQWVDPTLPPHTAPFQTGVSYRCICGRAQVLHVAGTLGEWALAYTLGRCFSVCAKLFKYGVR